MLILFVAEIVDFTTNPTKAYSFAALNGEGGYGKVYAAKSSIQPKVYSLSLSLYLSLSLSLSLIHCLFAYILCVGESGHQKDGPHIR